MTANATDNNAAATRHPAASPADAPTVARFPDFPPRDDMMNSIHIHDYGCQPALRLHLGNPDTTIVLGEVPIAWDVPRSRAGVRIPDLLAALDVCTDQILNQMGYAIHQVGSRRISCWKWHRIPPRGRMKPSGGGTTPLSE